MQHPTTYNFTVMLHSKLWMKSVAAGAPACRPRACQPAASRAASRQRQSRFHRVQKFGKSHRNCAAGAAACPATAAAYAAAATALPPGGIILRPIQPQPPLLTAEGFVPRTATLEAVPPELQPLLAAAVEACRAQLGSSLLGVYLRGSLVQPDSFLPGISDADFLVLHLPEHTQGSSSASSASGEGVVTDAAAASSLREAAERLQRQFPQCTKVGRLSGCRLLFPPLLGRFR